MKVTSSVAVITKMEFGYYDGKALGANSTWKLSGYSYNQDKNVYEDFSYMSDDTIVDDSSEFVKNAEEKFGKIITFYGTFIEIDDEVDSTSISMMANGLTAICRAYPSLKPFDSWYNGNVDDSAFLLIQYLYRRYQMAKYGIKEITQEFADTVLDSNPDAKSGGFKYHGCYFVYNENGGKPTYTAMDNSEGFCWTEDFDSFAKCLEYLEGGWPV